MQIKMNKTLTTGLVVGSLLGAAGTASLSVHAFKDSSKVPLEQLQKFTEVFQRIKSDYVEEVDDKKLMSDAISGMLTGLDPHSAYLDEESFTELQVGTSGEFGGLGIEVGMENGFVKVISPIDDRIRFFTWPFVRQPAWAGCDYRHRSPKQYFRP